MASQIHLPARLTETKAITVVALYSRRCDGSESLHGDTFRFESLPHHAEAKRAYDAARRRAETAQPTFINRLV